MATESGFSKGWKGFVDHKWSKIGQRLSVAGCLPRFTSKNSRTRAVLPETFRTISPLGDSVVFKGHRDWKPLFARSTNSAKMGYCGSRGTSRSRGRSGFNACKDFVTRGHYKDMQAGKLHGAMRFTVMGVPSSVKANAIVLFER